MILTIEEFEQIEAYLANNMTTQEKTSFEATINTNAELAQEVVIQRQIRMGLNALNIEKKLQASQQRTQTETPIIAFKPKSKSWAIAASVAVLMGVGVVFYQSQQGVSEELMTMANTELSDFNIKSFPIDTAFGSTQHEAIDSAAAVLPKTADATLLKQRSEWYFALAFIKKNKKKEAKTMLQRIATNPQHFYYDKAQSMLKKL